MKKIVGSLMAASISLAKKARSRTLPNPRVGAIVFDNDGKILGEGYHRSFGSAHAEVEAINDAIKKGYDTKGKNICVTLEPCNHQGKTPPCSDAIIKAGIKKVYVGTTDDCKKVCGKGIAKLISSGIEVNTGILEKECRDLNPGFHKYNTKALPFVRVKMAVSFNGVMGSTWFTSESARKRVHELRSFSDLIITGVGTIEKDDPKFYSKLESGIYNNRIAILDENMKLYDRYKEKSLNVIKTGNEVMIITGSDKKVNGLKVIKVDLNKNGLIDLKKLIPKLSEELNVREIMVEAGPKLTGSFISDAVDMIDKFNIFVAPVELDEDNKAPKMPNMVIEKEETLENTLAVEGHFDI